MTFIHHESVLVLRRVLGQRRDWGHSVVASRSILWGRAVSRCPTQSRPCPAPWVAPSSNTIIPSGWTRKERRLVTLNIYGTGEGATALALEIFPSLMSFEDSLIRNGNDQPQVTSISPTKSILSGRIPSNDSIILLWHKVYMPTLTCRTKFFSTPTFRCTEAADDVPMTSLPQQPTLPALVCQPAVYPCETFASGWQLSTLTVWFCSSGMGL
jgi:hypothetical protein